MADTINNQNINNWSWAIDLNDLNNNDTAAKENNQNESLIGKINDDNLTENYEGIDLRQVKSTISNNTLWISKNAKTSTQSTATISSGKQFFLRDLKITNDKSFSKN